MIILEEAVDTVQEMVRQPEKDIKVRKHVQELQDRALKVVRCHYTEDYQREDLRTETRSEEHTSELQSPS